MKTQLVIGLPETGKTTFLAALWQIVRSTDVKGALALDKLDTEREYVNRIWEDWANFKQVARTVTSGFKPIRMSLKNPGTSAISEITFPDVSGELFDSILKDREWSPEVQSLIQESEGLLVFVHPGQAKRGARIDEADAALTELGITEEAAAAPVDPVPFDEKQIPTQVKMVELLQLITDKTPHESTRVAIIISAWDLAEKHEHGSPEKWLAATLPLLSDYIRANPERFKVAVFGISAQGGDLSNAVETAALTKLDPWRRVRMVRDRKESNDLSEPIKWLLA